MGIFSFFKNSRRDFGSKETDAVVSVNGDGREGRSESGGAKSGGALKKETKSEPEGRRQQNGESGGKRWNVSDKLPKLSLGARRRARKVEAAPIDEATLGFAFVAQKPEDERRDAVRVPVAGLEIRVDRVGMVPCVNISATGIAFRFDKAHFRTGVTLTMALVYESEVSVEGIVAKVVRHDGGIVGCAFVELDVPQEDAISRFLLLGHKEQAAKRKCR